MALHADSVRPRENREKPRNGHMRRTCAAHDVMLCNSYVLLCYAMAVLICSGIFRLRFGLIDIIEKTDAGFAPLDGKTTKTIKGTLLTASKFLSIAWIPGWFL